MIVRVDDYTIHHANKFDSLQVRPTGSDDDSPLVLILVRSRSREAVELPDMMPEGASVNAVDEIVVIADVPSWDHGRRCIDDYIDHACSGTLLCDLRYILGAKEVPPEITEDVA